MAQAAQRNSIAASGVAQEFRTVVKPALPVQGLSRRSLFGTVAVALTAAGLAPLPSFGERKGQDVAAVPTTVAPNWDSLEDELIAALDRLDEADDHLRDAEDAWERWKKNNPHPAPDDPSTYAAYDARYEAAITSLGLGKLRANVWVYDHKAAEVRWRIARTPATTLADLRRKAMISAHEQANGPIHRSLIDALRNLPADASFGG